MSTQPERRDALIMLAGAQKFVRPISIALKPEDVAVLMEFAEEEPLEDRAV